MEETQYGTFPAGISLPGKIKNFKTQYCPLGVQSEKEKKKSCSADL